MESNRANSTALLHVLRITAKDCGAGFFALLLYALNQLIWADAHGHTAHVDFGQRCRDHRTNRYYDAAYGPNVWEYYFDPVSGVCALLPAATTYRIPQPPFTNLNTVFARGCTGPREPNSLDQATLRPAPHFNLFSADLSAWSAPAPQGANLKSRVHNSARRMRLLPHEQVPRWRYDHAWHHLMRSRASSVLTRHVRLRATPLAAATTFYRERILSLGANRPLLGIHLRGTDKMKSVGRRVCFVVFPHQSHL